MSVTLEFTIAAEDFQLGQILSGAEGMQVELEPIVPTGDMMMPFIWATGTSHGQFEERVRNNPKIAQLLLLDEVDTKRLYRIKWREQPTDLIDAIAEAEGSVLQARGTDEWIFQVRFADHDRLSQFHNYIIQESIPLHIDRTYSLSEAINYGHRFNLTSEQHEALMLALQRNYFATPRAVELDELAEELDITRQALSKRIRRGNEKVLRGVLLSPATSVEDTR